MGQDKCNSEFCRTRLHTILPSGVDELKTFTSHLFNTVAPENCFKAAAHTF